MKLLLRRKLLTNEAIAPDQHVRVQPEGIPEKEDFSSYASMNIIDKEDIEGEERREAEIAENLQSLTERSEMLEKELEVSIGRNNKILESDLHRAKAEIATQERALLEARLSLILSKKKYNELNFENRIPPFEEEELRSICREIGFQLNEARIKKRTYDYLVDLVDYLAKQL